MLYVGPFIILTIVQAFGLAVMLDKTSSAESKMFVFIGLCASLFLDYIIVNAFASDVTKALMSLFNFG